MDEIRKKYRGLGRVGGQIYLSDATEAECHAARNFFGKSFAPPLVIKLADFEKALQQTRFNGVTILDLLTAYFDDPIISHKEKRYNEKQLIIGMIDHVRSQTCNKTCLAWLDSLKNNNSKHGYRLISGITHPTPLEWVCKSLEWLEINGGTYHRLAILSAEVTSDPHALDMNTVAGKLLVHLLAFREEQEFPKNAGEKDSLYYKAGILCDTLSSTVSQVGLILSANNKEHTAYRAFRESNEACTLTLTNLANITAAQSPTGRVYLVENQMLFSQLCDKAASFHSPLVCTSGQPSQAVIRLLDMLAVAGTQFFYSGDFDVNGLLIAERLKNRYGESFQFWRTDPHHYALSRSQKVLAPERIRLLNELKNESLISITDCMKEHGYAGYQELIINLLFNDLITQGEGVENNNFK
ncbi:MAG: TIGR02679 family protein [Defluviitaleaceae bacterium]|nr:TIGR02679 family protein [Defluviitaleaceae bacterium]